MSLTNAQYNELMRNYSRTRFRHQHEMEERLNRIYAQCPRLKEISSLLPSASAALARAKLTGDSQAAQQASEQISALRAERDSLLASMHYTLSDLQPKYSCPDCRDTGYISRAEKCHCFQQASIRLLYEQSGIGNLLERENFQYFNLNLYSTEPNELLGGKSNRDHMRQLRTIYANYANQFRDGSPSLLIFGNPGVGKTFFTNCIAKVVLDHGFSVLYMTAPELFASAMQKFNQDYDSSQTDSSDYVMECSLLIIDDLGTENPTLYKLSHLFRIINSRLLSNKTTIISTNLFPDELEKIYTERIASRIMGCYTAIPIFGYDLRGS